MVLPFSTKGPKQFTSGFPIPKLTIFLGGKTQPQMVRRFSIGFTTIIYIYTYIHIRYFPLINLTRMFVQVFMWHLCHIYIYIIGFEITVISNYQLRCISFIRWEMELCSGFVGSASESWCVAQLQGRRLASVVIQRGCLMTPVAIPWLTWTTGWVLLGYISLTS